MCCIFVAGAAKMACAPEDGNYLHSGIALGYTSDLYKPQNHRLVQAFLRCKKGPTETPQTMNNR